jgi:hypothetical protein
VHERKAKGETSGGAVKPQRERERIVFILLTANQRPKKEKAYIPPPPGSVINAAYLCPRTERKSTGGKKCSVILNRKTKKKYK